MQDVVIKFEVIGLCNKIFVAINSKYFIDKFDAIKYIYIYIYNCNKFKCIAYK